MPLHNDVIGAAVSGPVHWDCIVDGKDCVVPLESQKAEKSRAVALDISAFWLSRLRHSSQRQRDKHYTGKHWNRHTLNSTIAEGSQSMDLAAMAQAAGADGVELREALSEYGNGRDNRIGDLIDFVQEEDEQ